MKALQKWIEVTGHFDHENDGEYVYDCELPEDGQEIRMAKTMLQRIIRIVIAERI